MRKIIALLLILTGAGSVYLFGGDKPMTNDEIIALQNAYIAQHGRPLQIMLNNQLPEYETGTVISKLGKKIPDDVKVSIQQFPDGTWGYIIAKIPPPPPPSVATST